jgi:hypothetical protein
MQRKNRQIFHIVTLVILVTFLFVEQSYAQQSSVRRQLNSIEDYYESRGYSLVFSTGSNERLRNGRERSHYVRLRRRVSYTIIGVCDLDCDDLDLFAYDENGNLVDEDIETDDIPILSITPRWTGEFRIRVDMYSCTVNPCWYGFHIYRN